MIDVMANHMGYINTSDYSNIAPFNDPSHYNEFLDCAVVPSWDHVGLENCWLYGLPDLNQTNEFVKTTLLEWISDFVQIYEIDGLRLDALLYVSRSFWSEFRKAVGGFTIGEAFHFDLLLLNSYQGSVDSLLNFPFYSTMRYVFEKTGSMNSLESYYGEASTTWNDMSVLGNFVNNHDVPRFLHNNDNIISFKAALAFSICSIGIPTLYYGDEQGFSGGIDPGNREPLWTSMNRDNEIYQFLKTINIFRKDSEFFNHEQIQRYSDDAFYAFTRGEHLFTFTNSQDYQARTITYHPYAAGTRLCNVLYLEDCVEVRNGKVPLILIGGEVKIFSPNIEEQTRVESVNLWQKVKSSLVEGISLDMKRTICEQGRLTQLNEGC